MFNINVIDSGTYGTIENMETNESKQETKPLNLDVT